MTAKPAGGRSVEEVLDLLNDPEFCADVLRTFREAAAIMVAPSSAEERQQQFEQLGQRFENRWGVPPPNTSELVDPDPRRRFSDAIASGHWGLVLVFPWTTNDQIRVTIKKIRSVIRKQHQDALITRHAQLVRWLDTIGFDRPTIARVVFGRRTGLRRLTAKQAIARTPESHQDELYDHYRGLGLTPKQIEQKILKTLRGSEAPASAAVRMTERRHVKRRERLNEHLASPVQSEPLSHALTLLFRARPDENNASVRLHTIAVRDAFEGTVAQVATAERRDADPQHDRLEAVLSGRWGTLPVFPWTTIPGIRASIKELRAMVRPQPQDGTGPAPAARPTPFEPLSDALISLFRALSQDDLVVRRHAFETRAIFLQTGAL